MRVQYINPFIASLDNAFLTMLGCKVQRGAVHLKEPHGPKYEISGVIGLSGDAVGSVVLNLPEKVALQAASTLLMTEKTEIDEEVVDAIGELTNMIAGAAKSELEEYHLMVSLPSVITGHDHEVRFPSNVRPICVPFTADWGPFMLEVGLTMAPAPVAVGV